MPVNTPLEEPNHERTESDTGKMIDLKKKRK
jgi:hypothetical protein